MKRLLLLAILAMPSAFSMQKKIEQYSESATIGAVVSTSLITGSAIVSAPVSIPLIAMGALAGVGTRFLYNSYFESLTNSNNKTDLLNKAKGNK